MHFFICDFPSFLHARMNVCTFFSVSLKYTGVQEMLQEHRAIGYNIMLVFQTNMVHVFMTWIIIPQYYIFLINI